MPPPPPPPTSYVEHPPRPALAPWIACYWTVTAADAPLGGRRILPDGCNDIIADLAGDPRLFVVGAMRRAAVVSLSGRVDMLGVRFRPGGALAFLHVPLRELTDRQVPLDDLWGTEARTLQSSLGTAPPHRRLATLERALEGALHRRHAEEDLAARAVKLIRRARGSIGIRQAAAALGVGERRLERAFDTSVGLSPKRFARIERFLHAAGRLGRGTAAQATIALEAGYADQAHFIREFKALAGVTPVQYAGERRVGFVQA